MSANLFRATKAKPKVDPRQSPMFEDFSDAVAAREAAEANLGYHENQRRGGLFNA